MGTQKTEQPPTGDDGDGGADEVVVFSDYVCPFCYLGRASLDQYRAQREEPLDAQWHAFDLRGHRRDESGEIQADVDDGKDEAYYDQVRENVERLGEKYDAPIDFDAVPDTDSWNAQQAALFVRDEHPEQFEAFDDGLFEAFWIEHRDIGDEDVIVDVAESVGLDGEAVREAIHDEAWAEKLELEFEDARQRGVTGVPTFAYDNHAARGAVPPEQLQRLIEG